MTQELINIIIATLIISSGSLVGVVTLALHRQFFNKIILSLVSLSAGTMLAAAFLHLLPESIELLGDTLPLQIALASFIAFFLLEKFLHWRHCHDENHVTHHTVGYLNLVGDTIHNFLDGVLIAASFATGTGLGIISTMAIALHEIPQELGDFAVLIHSGFRRKTAIFFNLLVSLTCVAGGILGYYASHSITAFSNYLLPIAAGGFIYISASDLIPDLKNVTQTKRVLSLVATFLLGVLLMLLIKD